ncbi:MAG: helix-turn-helix domain-containing protein [Hydrogenophaga sp.]|uniref:Crp/Fnr family transcriptional regulator n=1 Tax=Hydrogenophaga sp. TaxID=1904254 RepID=UPI002ABA58D8|nr:helix-turn-helix domain-containing protein [Hydrogenophaga sp.]MDZ4189628.1 helix-turn-helix domain-containing protein [Hydrogenophaga sp.]
MAPNTPIKFVYFPEDALVGLKHASGSGAAAPLALVGYDGVVGVAPLLGAPAEHFRAEVLHPGHAWRLGTEALNHESALDAGQMRVVLRYLQALNAQISQFALCQLQHPLNQRLGRWLQDAFDRVPGCDLRMEPAVLATWLGAEPGAVQTAIAQWVAEGVLAQRDGCITLLDRQLLAHHACA